MAATRSTGLFARILGLTALAVGLPAVSAAQVPPLVVQIVPGSELTANTPSEFPVVPDEHSSIMPLQQSFGSQEGWD